MIKTLRKKFIAIAMISTALVLFAIIGAINIANYINVNASLNAKLELIAYNGGTFPDSPVPPALDSNNDFKDNYSKHGIDKETPFETRYFSVLLYKDGSIATIDTGKIASISTSEASEYATSLYRNNKTSGFINQYKYLCVPASNSNNENMVLYVFINCSKELMSIKTYAFASISISLIGLFIVFILVCIFSKSATKPIVLSYEKQKRFITDASHEIKTPLTIIDANTEILEMMHGETEWTDSIRKQIARLTSLTEKLVFLSRMDEESSKLEMLSFNISDAILDTSIPFKTVADSKGRHLEISVAPDIFYTGNEAAIRQMISLLLDNAIKYSSDNGYIKVLFSVGANGKNKTLSVWNSVDEIEKGKLDYLFERFYRIDSSRNSKTGGFGIGLSVVQAIVEAHHGKISAKSEDGKSIEFTILL